MKSRDIFNQMNLIVFCFLSVLFLHAGQVFGETSPEYKTGTGAGFYGEYQYPEASDEGNRVVTESNEREESPDLANRDTEKSFPKTGETQTISFIVIGSVLLLISGGILLYKKKKTN